MSESTDEDVAARLREKIRNQAQDLLTKVELMSTPTRSTPSNLTPSASQTKLTNMTSPAKDGTPTPAMTTPAKLDTSTDASTTTSAVSSPVTSIDLTKRLQKLALERQKESKDERLKVIQADTSSHLSSVKTFQELNLPKHLLDAIFGMGFDRPSAIQEEALPRILSDPPRNLIGQAQSGSGKTAAFTLGMLYRIEIDPKSDAPTKPQALCLTPTRELAIQIVDKAVKPMAANMEGLKIQLGIAGSEVEKRRGVDAHMVVGTPGKIVTWINRKLMDTSQIRVFVLDEADTMVGEGGHRAKSLLIKKAMPSTCQSLLFSATFSTEVIDFASKMVERPDKILIENGESPEFLVLDVIKQLWIDTREYADGGKLEFLADIYSLLTIGQSIIFVQTKKDADMVHRTLSDAGYTCSILHGSVENEDRDQTMEAFRNGESNVLITTNVLARGVDVDNVCLVVNYDVPVDKDENPDYETYLHRIGRTGRFGRKGTAINLVSDAKSIEVLCAIERHFSKDGSEMIAKAPPDPEKLADLIEI